MTDNSIIRTDGTWQHLAVVFNKDSLNNDPVIYLDGVSQAITQTSTATTAYFSDGGGSLTIGARTTGGGFDGHIDEVHVYSRALSASEIAALAAGASGVQTE